MESIKINLVNKHKGLDRTATWKVLYEDLSRDIPYYTVKVKIDYLNGEEVAFVRYVEYTTDINIKYIIANGTRTRLSPIDTGYDDPSAINQCEYWWSLFNKTDLPKLEDFKKQIMLDMEAAGLFEFEPENI
jgi:hypothetical protein